MLVSKPGGHSAAWGALNETDLQQVRLDDLFDRILFLVQRSTECAQTDGPPVEFFNDGPQQLNIAIVESKAVDLHLVERIGSDLFVDATVVIDLGKVAHAPQQPVDYARRSASA